MMEMPSDETIDVMLAALAHMSFGMSRQRIFVRNVEHVPVAKLSERQKEHIVRVAWRFRRQMPHELVPSAALVREINAGREMRLLHERNAKKHKRQIAEASGGAPLFEWMAGR